MYLYQKYQLDKGGSTVQIMNQEEEEKGNEINLF